MTSSLADVLRKSFETLSPSEKKVARALLADYPVAGLEPVQRLAERAQVSAPTALRLLTKIGVSSYPEMQARLRQEISERSVSASALFAARSTGGEDEEETALRSAETVFTEGLSSSFSALPSGEFEAIVRMLADERHRILIVGGQISDILARHLATHLRMLRRDVAHVNLVKSERDLALLDVGKREVIVAFDYRRYEEMTISFCEQAKRQRAQVILFTDPWLSPAASHADFLLASAVRAPSPFDSLTPSLALVETVIAGVVESMGLGPVERVERFDELSDDTLESPAGPKSYRYSLEKDTA